MVPQYKNKNGFTLIEISIVLTIIGILLAAIITPYKIYTAEKARKTTVSNIELVNTAITNFLVQNGRYPCPAPLTAGPGDPLYGVETTCDPDDPAYPSYSYGECVDGLCFEISEKGTVDINPSPGETTLVDGVVRRGSIPFRSLGLAELETIDGFNARLQYAVSENLAKVETFVRGSGGISLIDSNGDSLVSPPASVHYLVYSTGRDKNGAYNREGGLINSCDTSRLDGENCNTAASGGADEAIYAYSEYNDSGSGDHYDDFMKQYSTLETPLWQVSGTGGFHVRDLLDDEAGMVAIASSTPEEQLDVGEEILVTDDGSATLGKSRFNTICDKTKNNCFSLEEFGGDHANFRCGGATPYAVGFADGKIKCSANPSEIRCPSGSKLQGVNPDGTLDCDTMIICPSENQRLCGNMHTLPSKRYIPPWDNEANEHTLTDGINYYRTWRCRDSGQWQLIALGGSCSCSPSETSYTISCNAYKGSGYWIGDVTYENAVSCNPGRDVDTTVIGADECVCDPQTETDDNYACPPGYSGTYTRSREWTCSSPSEGSFGPWTDNQDTQCVCDSSETQTQEFFCPPGYDDPSGSITRERSYDCSTDSWGPWYEVDDTCTCHGRTETVYESCPDGEVGEIQKQRQFNCATNNWGPWVENNSCGTVSHYWRNKSAGEGPYGSRVSPSLGDTCYNPGERKSCSSPTVSGGYLYYDVCECE